jgi:leader peptidase (prepilin peptidase)/N-methyltransferase
MVLLLASGLGLLAALILQALGRAISSATRFPLGTLLAIAAWPVALLYPLA